MATIQLPLLDRATPEGGVFRLAPVSDLMPPRAPLPGEQYRFHFDMTKCIGCKCCEVACSEQNNTPPHLRWRRVGEIETGEYPFTDRYHLSMGCNHCLDAACLKGCPVDAYTKDALTGIVLHSADACIGCQYCTWNCPYGVPQFNEERGVVGKCDLCHGRLTSGREPACVNACPQGAIAVELVSIEAWRESFRWEANAPGMPSAEETISTTRISRPAVQPAGTFEKADYHRVRPEHPHWPLVVMLTLTQMSVGAMAALWLAGVTSVEDKVSAVAALLVGHLALAASTAHLGRPAYAYRAIKMWMRSWLSREVLCFTIFAGAATAYAAALWLAPAIAWPAGAVTVAAGAAGIVASAFIYLVPARPAWNSWRTVAEYFLTAMALGPLLAGEFLPVAGAAAIAQALNAVGKWWWMRRSNEFELRQSARLLESDLRRAFLARLTLLAIGAALAFAGERWIGLGAMFAAELLGRWLFFVSVVPRNMAAAFFSREAA